MKNTEDTTRFSQASRSNYGIAVCITMLCSFVAVVACKKRNTSELATADSRNLYSFGGACGSRGFWTQTAVARTEDLSATITKLKDDPKCSKLYASLKDLSDIKSSFTPSDETGFRFSRAMTLTREIASIGTYLRMSDFKRGDTLALLLDRTLEQKTLQAQNMAENQTATAVSEGADGRLAVARNAAGSVENRMSVATQVGLDRLKRYYDALNDSAECVYGNPALGGTATITQTAQMLGSFASGDPATASKVADAFSGFAKMLRDSKFNSALKKQNDAVFAESIGCMLETVQYSYCAARDAQSILKNGGDRLQERLAPSGVIDKKSAFYGYYIMAYHLPTVVHWLNTLLADYVPKTMSDARLVNGISEIPVDLEIYSNKLRSIYSQSMRDYMHAETKNARASILLGMIQKMHLEVQFMTFPRMLASDFRLQRKPPVDGYFGMLPGFFVSSTKASQLSFRLIGITPEAMPPLCVAGSKELNGKRPLTFDQWAVNTPDGYQPPFFDQDPILDKPDHLTLPQLIKTQLDDLIQEAHTAGSDYFWRNFPLDLDAVSASAGSGQIASAMSSLLAIQSYLLDQIDQTRGVRTMEAMVNQKSMLELYNRINAVTTAYKQFADNLSSEEGGRKFISTVYEKFNLVFQGSSFLQQRLIGFVKRDLIKNVMKQKLGATSLESEILIAANDLAFDQVVNSLGSGVSDMEAVKNQLAASQSVNRTSLSAIDDAFGEKLIAVISYYRNIAINGGDTSSASVFSDSYLRSRMDSRVLPRRDSDRFLDRFYNSSLDAFELVGVRSYLRRSLHPDLYPMPIPWLAPGYHEDEFASNGTFWASLCALTLAFPKPERYASVCNGAVMHSPYEGGSGPDKLKKDGPLSLAYNNWNKSLNADKGQPEVFPSPTCAYYDVVRRNQIYGMTLDRLIVGDSSAVIPAPSTTGHGERSFLFSDAISNPEKQPAAVKSFVNKKMGKVPANTTYCNINGMVAPAICSDYEQTLIKRSVPQHGTVAVPCYDLKGQTFYCCNGSYAAGVLPGAGNAPCYRSLMDSNSLVLTLSDGDIPSP